MAITTEQASELLKDTADSILEDMWKEFGGQLDVEGWNDHDRSDFESGLRGMIIGHTRQLLNAAYTHSVFGDLAEMMEQPCEDAHKLHLLRELKRDVKIRKNSLGGGA